MDYRQYDIEDFTKDEFFLQWVIAKEHNATIFWTAWLIANPDKKEVVEEATRNIRLLRLGSDLEYNQQFLDTWQHLDKVWATHLAESVAKNASATHWRGWYKMAAVAALFVLAIATAYVIDSVDYSSLTTQYSEIRTIKLPDGTRVNLNGNSSLRYRKKFNTSAIREVWLKGEAFFSVEHRNNQKFIVHTDDGVIVEVLGTTFNVFKRRELTRVSLNTGKIRIKMEDEFYTSQGQLLPKEFIMKPGEVTQFNVIDRKAIREMVDPVNYSSWKEKNLVFSNTSLAEVAVILEDVYGYKVIMEEPFKSRRITGKFQSDDLNIFLKFLSKALNANVEQKDNRIIIKKIH
jgi:transmembrane sensor